MKTMKAIIKKTALGLLFVSLAFGQAIAQETPDVFFEQTCPFPVYTPSYSHLVDAPHCLVLEGASEDGLESFYLMAMSQDLRGQEIEADALSLSRPRILKLAEDGELAKQISVGYENRNSFIFGIFQVPNASSRFLAVGTVRDQELDYDKPFVVSFDGDLNILWQREIELPEAYRKQLWCHSVIDNAGGVFCAAEAYQGDEGNGVTHSCFGFRLTPEGTLDGLVELPWCSNTYAPFMFADGSEDYGCLEYVKTDELNLLRISHDMNSIHQRSLSLKYWENDPSGLFQSWFLQLNDQPTPIVVPLPDNSLILANDAHFAQQDLANGYAAGHGIGFLRLNAEGEAVYGVVDEDSVDDGEKGRGGIWQSSATMLDDGSFYYVYSLNSGTGYEYMDCFVVEKVDSDGNILWRRCWNRYLPEYGMMVYCPQNYISCSDDGCLITGYSYQSDVNDPGNVDYQNNVFMIKFFADGKLSTPEAEAHVRPYAFYPNPVGDCLGIQFSPDVTPTLVELYDAQGRLVMRQTASLESVNTTGLKAGLYTVKVTLDNGKTYSDTVIKK